MVRIQKQFSAMLEVLEYFVTREWIFHNDKIMTIHEKLSSEDKKMFRIYVKDIDKVEYIKNAILGTRQYCMKETLSSLPNARRHQNM